MITNIIELNSTKRNELKYSYVQWLSKSEFKYMLTLTFPEFTPRITTRNKLNKFIKHINQHIYKGRYRREENHLKGFVIREHTPEMDTDHYHILIENDPELPDYKSFCNFIDKRFSYFHDKKELLEIGGNAKNRRWAYYQLDDYYNFGDNDLEDYLMKQLNFAQYQYEKDDDFIGFLGKGNVEFGQLKF